MFAGKKLCDSIATTDRVSGESPRDGKGLSDAKFEGRTRFQDIISIALNTRRIVRGLIVPDLHAMRMQIAEMRSQLDRIERRERGSSDR